MDYNNTLPALRASLIPRPLPRFQYYNDFSYCCLCILIFLYSYLKDLVPEINQCVDKFLDNLESSALAKTPVSLRDEFSLLTLNVISKVSEK